MKVCFRTSTIWMGPLWVSHLSRDTRWSLDLEKSCFTGHCVSGCLSENQNALWLFLSLYDFVTSKGLPPEQQNGKWHSRVWHKIRQKRRNKWILTPPNEISGAGVVSVRFYKFLWLCILFGSICIFPFFCTGTGVSSRPPRSTRMEATVMPQVMYFMGGYNCSSSTTNWTWKMEKKIS